MGINDLDPLLVGDSEYRIERLKLTIRSKVMSKRPTRLQMLSFPSLKNILKRSDCQCSENRSKTHKRLRRTRFIWTKQDKTCKFRGIRLFRATYSIKTEEKKTINSLSLCQLDAGRLAEEKGQIGALFLPPASQHLTDVS